MKKYFAFLFSTAMLLSLFSSPVLASKYSSVDIAGFWNVEIKSRLWVSQLGRDTEEQNGIVNLDVQDMRFSIYEGTHKNYFGIFELKVRGKLCKFHLDSQAYPAIENMLIDRIEKMANQKGHSIIEINFKRLQPQIWPMLISQRLAKPRRLQICIRGVVNAIIDDKPRTRPFFYLCTIPFKELAVAGRQISPLGGVASGD